MIDAQRPEFDGPLDHAQFVELVHVGPDGAPELDRLFEVACGVLDGPGALLAVGITADSGKLLGHRGQRLVDRAVDEVGIVGIDRVRPQEGPGDQLGRDLRNGVDRPEHLQLVIRGESVSGLDLQRAGAPGRHGRDALLEHSRQIVRRCIPDGADGRHDAAALGQQFEVGGALEGTLEFVQSTPGPAGVGVTVHERRHQDPTAEIDLRILPQPLRRLAVAEIGDDSVPDQHPSVVDHRQIAQSGATARGPVSPKGEDACVDEQQCRHEGRDP